MSCGISRTTGGARARRTRFFPFVHYWRIQDENRFWNKSELSAVLDLVDAADRKLASALLNDSFLSNDILLVEDGALADGEELTNEPGAIVHLKQGRMGGVQRLGGLQSVGKAAMDITWFKEQIERASRSYDTGTGKETARVTTASGSLNAPRRRARAGGHQARRPKRRV